MFGVFVPSGLPHARGIPTAARRPPPATLPPLGGHPTAAASAGTALKLKPPASVPFANNGSVTVSLANLSPTAKGNPSLFTTYDFSDLGLPMDVSS